ncbi:MAG TPA: hypothetical protein VMA73_11415 [Streptosporangiaceae bacterium]|nr:hypothetical protein [Streptosporangiaceae bacterium]
MLTRTLRKRFGFEAEVIDPRGWALKGVPARTEFYTPAMADYYDLVVGLHPDQALRSVVESAAKVTVLVVPCCNFWTRDIRLGRDELIEQISEFHHSLGGASERVTLSFSGPVNHGLILRPPRPRNSLSPPGRGEADSVRGARPSDYFDEAERRPARGSGACRPGVSPASAT